MKFHAMKAKTIISMLVMLSVTGCVSTPLETTLVSNVGGLKVLSKSAEDEVIVFRSPEDKEQYCLAPAPDAVPSYGGGVSISLPEDSVSENSNVGADILGGRSPATLISRELLYRACEFSLNYKLDKEEATDIYEKTLDAIVNISSTLTLSGTKALEANTNTSSTNTDTSDDDDTSF